MRLFLLGVLMTGFTTASLFFLRFWRRTRDRLFGWFSLSFLLLSLNQLAFAVIGDRDEQVSVYTLRFFAFVIIVWAIVDKNRRDAR
jgi:hypothetical protein